MGIVILKNVSRTPSAPFVCSDVATVSVNQVKVVLNQRTGERGAKILSRRIPTTVRIPVNGESKPLNPDILLTPQVAAAFRRKILRGRLVLGHGERVEQYGNVLGNLVANRLIEVVEHSRPSEKKTVLVAQREEAKRRSIERINVRKKKKNITTTTKSTRSRSRKTSS